MAKSDQKYPEWWRRRALYKQVTFSSLRGQQIVKRWQRPRGPPSSEAQAATQTGFLNIVAAQKNSWPVDQVGARLIAEGSQYAWRDVIGRACVGRLSEFILEDESLRLVPQVQDLLDSITDVVGSLLVRTPAGWIGLELGTNGTVLTWNDAAEGPLWQTPDPIRQPIVTGEAVPVDPDFYVPGIIMTTDNQVLLGPT